MSRVYNIVDFNNISLIDKVSFINLKYFNVEIENITNWKHLYKHVIKFLYNDYREHILCLPNKSFNRDSKIDFGDEAYSFIMDAPEKITDNFYIETNYSQIDFFYKIKSLLEICNINFENLVIIYILENSNIKEVKQQCETRKLPSIDCLPINITKVKQVLTQHFKNGYRLSSHIEINKFRQYYSQELIEENNIIDNIIESVGMTYNNKVFIPENMLDRNVHYEILEFIKHTFKSNRNLISFLALYQKFENNFFDSYISDEKILQEYIKKTEHTLFIHRDYIVKYPHIKDPTDDIEVYLKEQYAPVVIDSIIKYFYNLDEKRIKLILTNIKTIISNTKNEYFHIDIVDLSENTLEQIKNIIHNEIEQYQYISLDRLLELLKERLPYVVEVNSHISDIGLKKALKHFLKDDFSINRNLISKSGENLNTDEVFFNFSKNKYSFKLDELNILKSDLNNTSINFKIIYENSMRISQEEFINLDQSKFNPIIIDSIDEVIEKFCLSDYISIKDINSFVLFPDAGFIWNIFLLESYVAKFSKKFKLVHNNYSERDVYGAIVKKDCPINSYIDLIADVVANSKLDIDKNTILNFICDKGYQSGRSWTNFENLKNKIRLLRNRKGF
ncbi:hypothetical protein AN641_04465 [Candidatus Epulonipiscioides gigas]|nr:hypothetical protein AN641_04465 [Epulopiscium sp. SCG-C07WGA-EpuloA2]